MVRFDVRYDKKVFDDVIKDIEKAPQTITVFAEKTIPALIEKELAPLKTEPNLPTLPFVWSLNPAKNAKARRWYFANKVKGNAGGRYQRSHRLVNSWKVTAGAFQKGIVVTVSNDFDRLEYVQGVRQVPSHKASGWARYEDVLLRAEQKATDTLIDAWFDILVSPASGSKYK